LPEDFIVPSMPYMGGKRKLSTKILNSIYETVGDFGALYDLFGGGGAISTAGLLAGHTVHYNELNAGVANLMRHLTQGGYLPDHWIDRATFQALKDGDSWYSGFVKVCWSFGNQQRDYMFGRDVEPIKKLGHFAVVYGCEKSRQRVICYFWRRHTIRALRAINFQPSSRVAAVGAVGSVGEEAKPVAGLQRILPTHTKRYH
jgi:hypothetical protein